MQRHRHPFRVFLVVSVRHAHSRRRKHYSELQPNEIVMSTPVTVSVGHNVQMSLVFLDQNGNPMLQTPTPDSPPTWSDSTPATGTLTSSGLTANELAVAAGADTVSVSVSVGGVTFSATQGITVTPASQVLTKVDIAATVA
jgi:hypothetical protein